MVNPLFRTVAPGDVLSVEYEGQLEDGTVFDSSKSRGAPFGPFVHGRRQIIEGYTQALEVRWTIINCVYFYFFMDVCLF